MVRVEAGLFFANADWVRSHILSRVTDEMKAVVLDAQNVPAIDVTAVRTLTELAEDLEQRGTQLLIAHDVGQVRDVIGRAERGDVHVRVYPSVQEAIDAVRKSEHG